MFAFAQRLKPQRHPIGAPGISEEQYERIAARLRAERSARPTPVASRFQPTVIITEGTRP